jgi:hypothetical protein
LDNRLLYLTIIVLLNAGVNLLHGLAHFELQVIPALLDSLFIAIVIGAAPLIALLVIFRGLYRAGGSLLFVFLLASLIYGLSHHFLVSGSDNAFSMSEGSASALFLVTSLLLIVTEVVGSWVAASVILRGAAISRHEFLK